MQQVDVNVISSPLKSSGYSGRTENYFYAIIPVNVVGFLVL